MDIIIREFKPEDYPEVLKLWKVTKQVALDRKWVYELKARRQPDLFLIAEVDGKIVGTAVSTHDVQFSQIHHLAVHPDYQGRGIGSKLLSEMERRLKARGCLGILITVSKKNPRYYEVLKFYRKRGFRVVGDYTHVGKIAGNREEVAKAFMSSNA